MTTRLRLAIAFFAAAALLAGGILLGRELSIDRCLDSGGAWNYKQAQCEGAAS